MQKGSLSLSDQVGLFKKTVEEYLPLHICNSADLSFHLSKSIFLFVIGVNDYALNFLKKKNNGQPIDDEAVAELLISTYGNHLGVSNNFLKAKIFPMAYISSLKGKKLKKEKKKRKMLQLIKIILTYNFMNIL